MPWGQPAKPALSEAEGMPALQEPALFQCCLAEELIASSRNKPSTCAAVFSSERFSSATVAVKFGEVGLKRTFRKSLSRQAVSALITGVSSGGQSSFVVNTTGPGRLSVQVRVSFATFFAECPDQRRRITSK